MRMKGSMMKSVFIVLQIIERYPLVMVSDSVDSRDMTVKVLEKGLGFARDQFELCLPPTGRAKENKVRVDLVGWIENLIFHFYFLLFF